MFERFKTMSRDELSQYHTAAMAASRIIDIVGITTILVVLMFTSPMTIIPGAIILYTFAHVGANLGETLDYLEERIIRAPKAKEDEGDK